MLEQFNHPEREPFILLDEGDLAYSERYDLVGRVVGKQLSEDHSSMEITLDCIDGTGLVYCNRSEIFIPTEQDIANMFNNNEL